MLELTKISALPIEGLRNLIENHRKRGETNSPLYIEAVRELEARVGKGLNFDKSFAIISAAAKAGHCISYKDLADASGAEWLKVHYEIGGHLGRLVEYAHRRKWPMLSAIVVNKVNVKSQKMEPGTLKGFVTAAKALNIPVLDGDEFLAEQQKLVFEWGKTI